MNGRYSQLYFTGEETKTHDLLKVPASVEQRWHLNEASLTPVLGLLELLSYEFCLLD